MQAQAALSALFFLGAEWILLTEKFETD